MTIRFKCPHCQKTLGVKDQLAGKKAACPVCKKALTIPAAVSAPADVEALAAAALADVPKPTEAAVESKPIEFTCPFCEADVRVASELGGKQTPCPKCKRIVKVPKLVEDKPKDWRAVDGQKVPAFARQAEPQAPDGAWAPAAARKVSQQALAEAGAVPEVPAEPVGIGVWIRRGVYGVAAVGVIVLAFVLLTNRKRESTLLEGLTRALEFIEPKSKIGPEATAAVQRAAGEFYAHKPEPKKALEYLGKSRALAGQLPTDGTHGIERDALLRDIALAWVDLGGGGKAMDDGTRVGWDRVQKELERTLLQIESPDARASALRDVTTRLLEKGGEGEMAAFGLAIKVEGTDEKAGKPAAVQQVVLLLVRGKADKAGEILPPPKGEELTDLPTRLAYSQGPARAGKYPEALKIADTTGPDPLHRLHALLGVAAIAVGNTNPAGRATNARPAAEKAFDLAWVEAKKGLKIPPWTLIELGCVAARTGLDQRVKEVLERLPDPAARGRVQLEVVLAQLENSAAFGDPAGVSLPDKASLSHGLALEALARHNARVGSRAAVLDSVEGLEENLRPFVLVGLALGEEDATRR